jgi:hypothetical protein
MSVSARRVLRLNRTMISNQGLPYVGRFACGWHRLSTTDPLRVQVHRTGPRPARPGGGPDRGAGAIYGWTVAGQKPRDWETPPPRRNSTWLSNLNARVLKKLESKLDPENLVEVADKQLGRSQRHSGEASRSSVAMLQTKARYLRQAGRIDEALIVSNSAYEQRIRFQGPEHPDTLETELRLAVLLVECSRLADAEPHFAHVVDASAQQPDFDRDTASLAARWLAHTRRLLREENGEA